MDWLCLEIDHAHIAEKIRHVWLLFEQKEGVGEKGLTVKEITQKKKLSIQ